MMWEVLGLFLGVFILFAIRYYYHKRTRYLGGIPIMDESLSDTYKKVYKGLADTVIAPAFKTIGQEIDLEPLLVVDADRVVYVDKKSVRLLGKHTLIYDGYAVNTSTDGITVNHMAYRLNHKTINHTDSTHYVLKFEGGFDLMVRHSMPNADVWYNFKDVDKITQFCTVYSYSLLCK